MKINHSDLPQVDIPLNPGPGDCMPSVLAAGRVAPVVRFDYYGGTILDVCDMDLARTVLADRRLSKDVALAPEWMRLSGELLGAQPEAEVARAMVMSDGAEHARIRRLHSRILASLDTEKWETHLARLVEELLDGLATEEAAGGGEVNLVECYTHPVPRGSGCNLLGIPLEFRAELKRITDDIIYSSDPAMRERGIGALAGAAVGWVRDPGVLSKGVITGLIDSIGGEAAVTIDEVVTWTIGLTMASYESTASLISSAMLEALRKPAGQRPGSEAEIEAWIEETLRVHPPFPHATWRFATEDLELGDYFIPKGTPVQINVAAANRCLDGELADDFDPNTSRSHISFGGGRHYCMGTSVARLEAKTALSGFLSRFPNARLSETTDVSWESGWLTRRISVLPVVLGAATGSPQPDHGRHDHRG